MRGVSDKKAVVLEQEQRVQLEGFARSRALPHALVLRAQIVLLAAEGKQNRQIAVTTKMSRQTVGKWRERFVSRGLEGLYDEYRPGRPRSIDGERIAEMVNRTLQSKPQGATQWSCREMAETTGLSKSTVQRVWSAFGLQPHRQESFKLSTDPFFIEKLRDIVGLYLNPPQNALVLCVDEKSQCQASSGPSRCFPWGLATLKG